MGACGKTVAALESASPLIEQRELGGHPERVVQLSLAPGNAAVTGALNVPRASIARRSCSAGRIRQPCAGQPRPPVRSLLDQTGREPFAAETLLGFVRRITGLRLRSSR